MSESPVFVALSAFGADTVRRHGQAHFLALVAEAGAAGAEIRRELFGDVLPPLEPLRAVARAAGLRLVYSAPFELYDVHGALQGEALAVLAAEAHAVGAEILKVSLGYAGLSADAAALARGLDALPVPVLIENDQTPQGGRIAPLRAFLALMASSTPAPSLRVTFDIGNWAWTGDDAAIAAAALGDAVTYVHCKAAATRDGRLTAVPLETEAPETRALFACFAPNLPRAIEYPITAADGDLVGELRRHVARLAIL
ncbi:MAG: hypothetical protein P4M00_12125 [Azospirillaceae bacterium]|nr:hypothetical protein [Azospirillaceae bacterium]